MEFRVYETSVKQTQKPEPLYVRLQLSSAGDLEINAVEKDGRWKNCLLVLRADGTCYRVSSVDPRLGFRLDHYGRIQES